MVRSPSAGSGTETGVGPGASQDLDLRLQLDAKGEPRSDTLGWEDENEEGSDDRSSDSGMEGASGVEAGPVEGSALADGLGRYAAAQVMQS